MKYCAKRKMEGSLSDIIRSCHQEPNDFAVTEFDDLLLQPTEATATAEQGLTVAAEGAGPLQCVHCPFTAALDDQLFLHLAKDHGQKIPIKTCLACNFETTIESTFKQHLVIHPDSTKCPNCPPTAPSTSQTPHKCHCNSFFCSYPECGYSAKQKTSLTAHYAKKHGQTQYLKKCTLCEYTTTFEKSLKAHLEKHLPRDQRSFRCPFEDCQYATSQKQNLNYHLTSKHKEKPVRKCQHCDFTTTTSLKAHLETHGKKSLQCTYEGCSFIATRKEVLHGHFAKIHGEVSRLTNKCPQCEYVTANLNNLKSHLRKHFTKTFKCSYQGCTYSTIWEESLNSHLANVHREIVHLKECPHCDYSTGNVKNLKAHMDIHAETKSFPCSHEGCTYSTTWKESLNAHLAKVHNETKYLKRCSQCEYSTGYLSALKKHMEIHTPSIRKNYDCHYAGCTYRAQSKPYLNAHFARSHGELKYMKKCPHCDFTTLYNASLKKHKETHTNLKSHKCPYSECTYTTSWQHSFKKHLTREHGEVKHLRKCPHCEYSTAGGGLKAHIETHFDSRRKFRCHHADCGFKASRHEAVKAHLVKKHDEAWHLLRCGNCDYSTVYYCNLKKHVASHFT